ncbi:hypothetical protein AHAS_Ahas16G0081500 [Arachis hypogaea]
MKKKIISKKEKPYYNKTHDLSCSTRSIARVFADLSEQKKILGHTLWENLHNSCQDRRCTGPKFRRFKGATLASLTTSVTDMSIVGEGDLLKFKTTFILFVQKYFMLLTIISTVSQVHKIICPSCGDSPTMELGISCAKLPDQKDQSPESRK